MGKLKALWTKDPGLAVSGGAHALALVLLLVSFSRPEKFEDAVETVSVDMVSTSEFDQIMNGEKNAKLAPKPERRVDKVAELEDHKPAPPLAEAKKDTPPEPARDKPNDDPGQAEKPPEPTAAVPPPPSPTPPERAAAPAPPVPTPPERPVEKAEAPKSEPPISEPPKSEPPKSEAPIPPPKPAEVKPPPPEAEAIEPTPPPRPKLEPKKEAKREPKPVPVPHPRPVEKKVAKVIPPTPPTPEPPPKPELKPEPKKNMLDQVTSLLASMKPPKPVEKQKAGNDAPEAPSRSSFSLDKITAFLDHAAPERKASTGQKLTQTASLGAPNTHADKMSPSLMGQLDNWLIDHYRGCWSYFGLGATQNYVPSVRVRMAEDGSLIGAPALLNPPSDPNLRSLADSAIRAVNRCNPMTIPDRFKPYYNAWRSRVVRFDPKEMS